MTTIDTSQERSFAGRRSFLQNTDVTLVTGIDARYPPPPFHPEEFYPELGSLGFCTTTAGPNKVYAAIRTCLYQMGLDRDRFGTPAWNPLSELVANGRRVVIKPNMVRHFNETIGESLDVVVTHWSVVRPLVDYAWLAVGRTGQVVIAEAAQHDCELDVLKRHFKVEELLQYYNDNNYPLRFVDARNEFVVARDGVLLKTIRLAGDPEGSILVNLAGASEFNENGLQPELLRGSDNDDAETAHHHSGGRHNYLISKTILSADLLINVPKVKTHYKIGLTAAMKNLVGINADKNYLPHWRIGFVESGGDQFQSRNLRSRVRLAVFKMLRPLLRRGGVFNWLAFIGAKVLHLFNLRNNFGGGTWHGNDTIWRTTLDLNKALFYADFDGVVGERPFSDRAYLTIADAIVAGQGRGPMGPNARPLGVVVGAANPVACDAVLARCVGFDWRRVRFLEKAFRIRRLPLIELPTPDSILVRWCDVASPTAEEKPLAQVTENWKFEAPPGWKGFIEL